jgi:hypothetical protein
LGGHGGEFGIGRLSDECDWFELLLMLEGLTRVVGMSRNVSQRITKRADGEHEIELCGNRRIVRKMRSES